MDQERFSRAFSFVLHSGTEVYPVMMKRRDNGRLAFRISAGGNTLAAGEEVAENVMIAKALSEGYAVRCASLDGKTTGLYKSGQRSVREVKIHAANSTRVA